MCQPKFRYNFRPGPSRTESNIRFAKPLYWQMVFSHVSNNVRNWFRQNDFWKKIAFGPFSREAAHITIVQGQLRKQKTDKSLSAIPPTMRQPSQDDQGGLKEASRRPQSWRSGSEALPAAIDITRTSQQGGKQTCNKHFFPFLSPFDSTFGG